MALEFNASKRKEIRSWRGGWGGDVLSVQIVRRVYAQVRVLKGAQSLGSDLHQSEVCARRTQYLTMDYLVLQGYKFHQAVPFDPLGIALWRCIKTECRARFFATSQKEIVPHEDNLLTHNHPVSRTKLVKKLVFKEFHKFVRRREGQVTDFMVKDHLMKFLDQAYGSTLNADEMRCVKSAIIKYTHLYKAQLRKIARTEDEQRARRGPSDDQEWRIISSEEEDEILSVVDETDDTDQAPAYEGHGEDVEDSTVDGSSDDPQPSWHVGDPSGSGLCPSRIMMSQEPGPSNISELTHHDLSYNNQVGGRSDDDDEKFFRSLLPIFRSMDPRNKAMMLAQLQQNISEITYKPE